MTKGEASALPIRALLVDDNPSDRMLERRLMEKEIPNVSVVEIRSKADLEEHISRGDFDIVVTDYQLIWSNGLEVLKMTKGRYPEKPVIMVTGTGSEEIAVLAMKSGLNDYIIKNGNHIKKLPVSMMSAVSHAKVMRCSIETEARMEYILGLLKVGVFQADVHGNIRSANDQFYSLLSKGKKEHLQKNLFDNLLTIEGLPFNADMDLAKRPNGLLCRFETKDGMKLLRLRIAEHDIGEGGTMHGLLEDVTDFIMVEMQRDVAMRKIDEYARQFGSLSDLMRNPISVLYSLTQGLDEKKAKMAEGEMVKISEVLEVLDKGWIETRQLVREWQDLYK